MPPSAPVLGAKGKLYRNTGTYTTPVWDLIPNVKDVMFPLVFKEYDATARAGEGWEASEPTVAMLSGSLVMLHNPADPDLQAFIAAAWNRLPQELLNLDAPVSDTGSQGSRASYKIFKQERKEPVGSMMEQNFDLKLCLADHPPEYVVVP